MILGAHRHSNLLSMISLSVQLQDWPVVIGNTEPTKLKSMCCLILCLLRYPLICCNGRAQNGDVSNRRETFLNIRTGSAVILKPKTWLHIKKNILKYKYENENKVICLCGDFINKETFQVTSHHTFF